VKGRGAGGIRVVSRHGTLRFTATSEATTVLVFPSLPPLSQAHTHTHTHHTLTLHRHRHIQQVPVVHLTRRSEVHRSPARPKGKQASPPALLLRKASSFSCQKCTTTTHATAMVNHAAIASRLGVPLTVVQGRFAHPQVMMRQFSVKELKVIRV